MPSLRQRVMNALDDLHKVGRISLETPPEDIKKMLCGLGIEEACDDQKWNSVVRKYVHDWKRRVEQLHKNMQSKYQKVEESRTMQQSSTYADDENISQDGEAISQEQHGDGYVADVEVDEKLLRQMFVPKKLAVDPRVILIYLYLRAQGLIKCDFSTFVNGTVLAYWREKGLDIAVYLTENVV